LGLTDQFLHSRIPQIKYDDEVIELKQEVSQKNVPEDNSADDESQDVKALTLAKPGMITFQPNEYSFFMYSHWNLIDSLFHSPYIATRLGVWKEPGKRKLNTFLARIGIPLRECTLSYSVMKLECRDLLGGKLEEHAEEFGLDPDALVFPSFLRVLHTYLLLKLTLPSVTS
jgi:cell division control protein 45